MPPINSGVTSKAATSSSKNLNAPNFGHMHLDLKREPRLRMKEIFSIGSRDIEGRNKDSTRSESSNPDGSSQRSVSETGRPAWRPSASAIKQLEAANVVTPQAIFEKLNLARQLQGHDKASGAADDLRARKKEVLRNYLRVQTHLNLERGQYGAVSGFPDMKTLMPNLLEVNANSNKLGLHHFLRFNCTILRLSSNLITDEALEKDIEVCKYISQVPDKLAKTYLMQTLRILDISSNLFSDFYMVCTLLSYFPLLQTVILSNNSLTVPTMDANRRKVTVDEYLKSDPLVYNIPPHNNDGYVIASTGLPYLSAQSQHANIPVASSVTTLVMDGISMTPSFFAAISKAFPNLERLSVRGSSITHVMLSSLLKLPSIVELDVSDNLGIGNIEYLKSYALHAPGTNLCTIQAHNSIGTISHKEGPVYYLWLDFNNNLISESRNPYFRPDNTFRTIEISLFQNSGIRKTLRSGEVVPVKIDTQLPRVSAPSGLLSVSKTSLEDVASSLQQLTAGMEEFDSTDLDLFNKRTTINESVLDDINTALRNLQLVSDDEAQQAKTKTEAEKPQQQKAKATKFALSPVKPLSNYLITTADTMHLPRSLKADSQQSQGTKASVDTTKVSASRLGSSSWKSFASSGAPLTIAAILGGIGAPADSIVAAPTLRLTASSMSKDRSESFSYPEATSMQPSSYQTRTRTHSRSPSTAQKSPPRAPMYKRPDSTRRNLVLGTGQTAVDAYLADAATKFASNEIIMGALALVKQSHDSHMPGHGTISSRRDTSELQDATPLATNDPTITSDLTLDGERTPPKDPFNRASVDAPRSDKSPLIVYRLHFHSEDRGTISESGRDQKPFSIRNNEVMKGSAIREMDLTDETLAAEVVSSFVRASICGALAKSAPASLSQSRLSMLEDIDDLSDPADNELDYRSVKSQDMIEHENLLASYSTARLADPKPAPHIRAASAPPRQIVTEHSPEPASDKESSTLPPPVFVGANTFLTGTDYVQEISDIQEEPIVEHSPAPGLFDDTLLTRRVREGLDIITGPVDVDGIIRSESPRQRDIISFLPRGHRSSLRDVYMALQMVLENPITTYSTITDEEILVSLLQQVN